MLKIVYMINHTFKVKKFSAAVAMFSTSLSGRSQAETMQMCFALNLLTQVARARMHEL